MNILIGLFAVMLVFVSFSVWSIYKLGMRGGTRVAVGVASVIPHTLLNPMFWILSIGVFLACYYAFRAV